MIDLQAARRFLNERERNRQEVLDISFKQATMDFQAIVHRIEEGYRPMRIYQWGSLTDRGRFSEISDIDIAVEGIDSAERFFALLKDCERLTQFPLDIVQIERIEPEYAALVREKGRIVYERSSQDPKSQE